ncbi:hypothetical protein K0M31_015001 [Melipona bicolor]|uniref:Uncharacterized protein n=1 Tax=Melipona bicolor TaxID=60889 RepID=A0AA40FFX3_9HYME|nr:hypothetical protein K0M31_015001 [Melipona bicolor]
MYFFLNASIYAVQKSAVASNTQQNLVFTRSLSLVHGSSCIVRVAFFSLLSFEVSLSLPVDTHFAENSSDDRASSKYFETHLRASSGGESVNDEALGSGGGEAVAGGESMTFNAHPRGRLAIIPRKRRD